MHTHSIKLHPPPHTSHTHFTLHPPLTLHPPPHISHTHFTLFFTPFSLPIPVLPPCALQGADPQMVTTPTLDPLKLTQNNM